MLFDIRHHCVHISGRKEVRWKKSTKNSVDELETIWYICTMASTESEIVLGFPGSWIVLNNCGDFERKSQNVA